MENKIFLEQMKLYYDSLKYFSIEDSFLILKLNNIFKIPLRHVNLYTLDQSVFTLTPVEIFQLIYVNELLYKNSLTDSEIDFIKSYTKKYLELSDKIKNNEDVKANTIWCLEIPINNAYKDEFLEFPACQIIISEIDKHNEELNSGLGNKQKLVLIKGGNPNFDIVTQGDSIKNFEQAGFTTIFLITSAIVATCLYIAFFIIGVK